MKHVRFPKHKNHPYPRQSHTHTKTHAYTYEMYAHLFSIYLYHAVYLCVRYGQ